MNTIIKKIVDVLIDHKGNDNVYNVLFLGDSHVSTEWVHPNMRDIVEYVLKDFLEKQIHDWKSPYFQLRFLNAGLNGGDTKEFIERAPVDIINFKPNLIIMIGGDNDTPEISIAEHRENLSKLKKVLSQNADYFVYCTTPYSGSSKHNEIYNGYRKAALELPREHNEIFIDLFEEYSKYDVDRFYTFKLQNLFEIKQFPLGNLGKEHIDYIHPNILGQAYISKIILKYVFDINFDPERYYADVKNELKYPEYEIKNTI